MEEEVGGNEEEDLGGNEEEEEEDGNWDEEGNVDEEEVKTGEEEVEVKSGERGESVGECPGDLSSKLLILWYTASNHGEVTFIKGQL